MARLTFLELERYKAFQSSVRLDFARLTVVLGRNNSGKSALCRAPLFLTQVFDPRGRQPFPMRIGELDYGGNLLDACFSRGPAGFRATLGVDASPTRAVVLSASADEDHRFEQFFHELRLEGEETERVVEPGTRPSWETVRAALAARPWLTPLASTARILAGVRTQPERSYEYLGYPVDGVGITGEHAPHRLAEVADEDPGRLELLNAWLAENLDVRLTVDRRDRDFQLLVSPVRGDPRTKVNLRDCGQGLAQVLPLCVALRLSEPSRLPRLLTIEQPELHLHPYAHASLAELLIETATTPEGPDLLVETHSDALVLRLRSAVAEERLSPHDVRLYFVEEREEGLGSVVKPIELDELGIPRWWPKGIFAEDHDEFLRIRRAIQKRRQSV